MDKCRTRLCAQIEGAPIPAKRTIPVVLDPGKTAADDKELFERWVSTVSYTGESATTTSQGHSLSSGHGPSASLAIFEKCGTYDDVERHDPSDHKRLRRHGSFRSRGIAATSQDTGFDPLSTMSTHKTLYVITPPFLSKRVGGRR
ncbi:hypothetical protein Plhal710r2_c038g0133731 [Plasmopara halstedii]